MKPTDDRLVLVRRSTLAPTRDTCVVRIKSEVYASATKLACETGKSLSDMISILAEYAITRVHLIDAE